MILSRKNIALFLFVILSGILLERGIPHVHEIHEGHTKIDFSHKSDQHENEEEAEEKIHGSIYQSFENDISFSSPFIHCSFQLEVDEINNYQNPIKNNFNILPKVLNSILFLIKYYSSTAPPSFL